MLVAKQAEHEFLGDRRAAMGDECEHEPGEPGVMQPGDRERRGMFV